MATARDNFTGTAATAIGTYSANYVQVRGSAATMFLEDSPATGAGSGTQLSTYRSAGTVFPNTFGHLWEYRGLSTVATDCMISAPMNECVYAGANQLSAWLGLRSDGAGTNFYFLDVRVSGVGKTFTITKRVSGTNSDVVATSAAGIWTTGDVVAFACVGTRLIAMVNGDIVMEGTDSSLASGAPAIGHFMTNTLSSATNYWSMSFIDYDDAFVFPGYAGKASRILNGLPGTVRRF